MNTPLEPGDRVEMTELGINQGLDGHKKRRTGVVIMNGRHLPDCFIMVKRRGQKQPEKWARDFWRKAEDSL